MRISPATVTAVLNITYCSFYFVKAIFVTLLQRARSAQVIVREIAPRFGFFLDFTYPTINKS